MTANPDTCIRGCTRRDGDPARTHRDNVICDRCTDQLNRWLTDIPDRYALLPWLTEHGTSPPDPDHRTPKRKHAPAPMRLDVVDLLDQRRGRRWNGTIPSFEDHRGTLGIVGSWARMVREERHVTALETQATVTSECALLRKNLAWIVTHEWVVELHDDLRRLDRDLAAAVGDHRPQPVGHCVAIVRKPTENGTRVTVCGGPLLPNRDDFGVHCPACGDCWTADDLRRHSAIAELI